MGALDKKEIIHRIEEMKNGGSLGFRLASCFGAGVVLVALNPAYPGKGQKKYLMNWGKDERDARSKKPLIEADKAKTIASWVAERGPEWLPRPV